MDEFEKARDHSLTALQMFLAGYGIFVVYRVCKAIVTDFWRAPL